MSAIGIFRTCVQLAAKVCFPPSRVVECTAANVSDQPFRDVFSRRSDVRFWDLGDQEQPALFRSLLGSHHAVGSLTMAPPVQSTVDCVALSQSETPERLCQQQLGIKPYCSGAFRMTE